MGQASALAYQDTQLANIFLELKEIKLALATLQRQDDLSTAERSNMTYRLTEAEKAIHALEILPARNTQNFFQAAGCSINALYLLVAGGSLLATLAAVTVSIVALILR